ncbi:LamB/YcsF family protein, partial [Rhizobium sp. SIMBA_035]
GHPVFREAFVDRAYQPDGTLVPRTHEGAVLHDPDAVVAQAVRLATRGEVLAVDGSVVRVQADSLCIHGDTPGAVSMAAAVQQGLQQAGVQIEAFA